jgi:hypothetical protein
LTKIKAVNGALGELIALESSALREYSVTSATGIAGLLMA